MEKEKKTLNKIQDIHRRKYLANIILLPQLHQKKIKEYFQVIFTFSALIFALIFAIEPTLTTISQLAKQISDAQQVTQALQTKILYLSQLNTAYTTLQPTLPIILSAIPQSERAQLLLAQLQALAQQDNISVTVLNAQADPLSINPMGKDIIFTLNAQGSYQNIRSFLQQSIQLQRIIVPTSITISKSLGIRSITLLLNGKAYFML